MKRNKLAQKLRVKTEVMRVLTVDDLEGPLGGYVVEGGRSETSMCGYTGGVTSMWTFKSDVSY